jgi:hypothetical protein
MENAIIGTIGTVMVSFAIILIFVAGIWFLVSKVRMWNQIASKRFITSDQAQRLKEQNESIQTQLKALKKS